MGKGRWVPTHLVLAFFMIVSTALSLVSDSNKQRCGRH